MNLKNNVVSNLSVQTISVMSRRGQGLCADPVLGSLHTFRTRPETAKSFGFQRHLAFHLTFLSKAGVNCC